MKKYQFTLFTIGTVLLGVATGGVAVALVTLENPMIAFGFIGTSLFSMFLSDYYHKIHKMMED